jgi:FkbM family methyltransferase
MFDKLIKLKENGFIPDVIFDIGAHHGDWTKNCQKIYTNCRYILVEPIEYPELNEIKKKRNVRVFNELLNDKVEVVNWYEMKNTGDSMFKEMSLSFKNCSVTKKTSITLDKLIENKVGILDNCNNYLIKIDCQGAELPILKGAENVLKKTDFVILELPFFGKYNETVPTFLEHITFMNDNGFIPYDFLESHYVGNNVGQKFNMQVDIMFINKNHFFNQSVQNI